MGTDQFNAGGSPCNGLASHPGGVEILLVVLFSGNQLEDKLWLDGPLALKQRLDLLLPILPSYKVPTCQT